MLKIGSAFWKFPGDILRLGGGTVMSYGYLNIVWGCVSVGNGDCQWGLPDALAEQAEHGKPALTPNNMFMIMNSKAHSKHTGTICLAMQANADKKGKCIFGERLAACSPCPRPLPISECMERISVGDHRDTHQQANSQELYVACSPLPSWAGI